MTIKFLVHFSEECLARGWSVTELPTSLMCCGWLADVRGFGDRVMW